MRARLNSLSGRDNTVSGCQHRLFSGRSGFNRVLLNDCLRNRTELRVRRVEELRVIDALDHADCGFRQPTPGREPQTLSRESARQRGEEGSAALRFRIDRSGRVLDYKYASKYLAHPRSAWFN